MSNKKETKRTAASFLKTACCIFTPSVFIIYALAYFAASNHKFVPTFGTVCIAFVFSLIISLTVSLYGKMSFAAAHAINFAVLGIAYYLTVVVLRGLYADGTQTLIAMTLYVVIYAAATAVAVAVKGRKRKLVTDMKQYNSKFN